MEMNKEYASKGVAGAGLGTGIAGLSLGVLNSLGGLGALAGNWGRNNSAQNDVLSAMLAAEMVRGGVRPVTACGSDCDPVTQREMKLIQEIAAKDSAIALRDANTYNDQKSLEMYKYIDGRFREVEAQLANQAVQNQATKDSFMLVRQEMNCCCDKLEEKVRCEAQKRKCSDNAIVNYLNQTFYAKNTANVTTGTTTTPQPTYNPLPVFDCDCDCN